MHLTILNANFHFYQLNNRNCLFNCHSNITKLFCCRFNVSEGKSKLFISCQIGSSMNWLTDEFVPSNCFSANCRIPCYVDLEKPYDCVPRDKLWAVLLEYDVRGQLLAAIKSLYKQSEVCVHVNGIKTKLFNVSVRLGQGCVLSPLLFIIYMDKIDKDSSSSSGITFGECNVRCLVLMTLHC